MSVRLIDHLDESTPFTFHQAQASFSSRLPRAFPVPDARSMASSLLMYSNYSKFNYGALQAQISLLSGEDLEHQNKSTGIGLPAQGSKMLIPSINMVTKHNNGTLNQWQVIPQAFL
jgi:hypothetical protein